MKIDHQPCVLGTKLIGWEQSNYVLLLIFDNNTALKIYNPDYKLCEKWPEYDG